MFERNRSNQRTKKVSLGITCALVSFLATLLWPTPVAATPASEDDLDIHNDALTAPDADRMPLNLSTLSDTMDPSGYYETSEYLIGHVAVGLILPESNGAEEAQSEEWTSEEIAKVQAEVQDALNWWASLEPAANLTFTVEAHVRVPTGYEPITHRLGEQGLWIGETMAALGYENDNYFSAVRSYVNDLRERVDSDWAFAIFVADSSDDDDGRFSDNYFAYAYIGGPFMVMTYDNYSYSIHNMDAVAAHEIGHVFFALDQYLSAGVSCDARSGYLNVNNGNSLTGEACPSNEISIMRGGLSPYYTQSVDYFARGQVGWWDSDEDGLLDPVDPDPQQPQQPEQPETATTFSIFVPVVQR